MEKYLKYWMTVPHIAYLERQKNIPFKREKNNLSTILVNKDIRDQMMDGYGFTLTGVSADLIAKLSEKKCGELLTELFTEKGINISVLRLSIGASDLSRAVFSYCDFPAETTDTALARFDLMAGDKNVVPVLRKILKLSPDVKILASPWSAPPCVKTNGSFIGGHLKPEYYDWYAKYFIKYILAMKKEGIAIYGITVQNEPLHDGNEPSMIMTAVEQIEFIKRLGPAFRAAGLNTKIFCWDHNCDRADYPIRVFLDKEASPYVDGSAWHKYRGDIDVLQSMREMFPDKNIWFTEQWTWKNGDFAGDLKWHAREIDIGAPRRGAKVVLKWNLISDSDCSSHTPGGSSESLGALTISDSGEIERKVAYYLIGHSSKFVPPGSVRVDSNTEDRLPNVAYETPDGKIVLVVLNDSERERSFNIANGDYSALIKLPAGALATFVW